MRTLLRQVTLWASSLTILGLAVPVQAGTQTDADVDRAVEAVRTKAAAGDAVAQFTLGSLLFYVRLQPAEAVALFRAAAGQGLAAAELQMGQLYDFGLAVEPDAREALGWYRKAADHGSAAAARVVADFYRLGRGVMADPAEAAAWYRRGADGGDIRAQYQLGQLYFDGAGLTRDYPSAYVWYSLAANQAPLEDNRKGLIELRNIAAARMTEGEVAAAERRVAEWRGR